MMLSLSDLIEAIISQFEFTFIIIQIMDLDQKELENQELKPLAFRLKNNNWLIRKRAYEQILTVILKAKSINEELSIQNQPFTVAKFIAYLNNLVEEKHPNVLLKGLQCAEAILRLDSKTGKQFNKLVVQGLQKFPLLTQQRKVVLQKFLEILQLCKIQANTLSNRLNLPQEKSVMFVIEVIGALQMTSLKGKLLEISKKHPKKDVKELAAEIAQELNNQQEQSRVIEEEIKVKTTTKGIPSKKQQPKKAFKMDLIQKIPQFEQLTAKEQQTYSQQLLANIDQISMLPLSGSLSSFCYYIQLMIEFNNQIISTNGVKMLTNLIKNKSQLISSSFPLLFLFRKFKTHKTHATNINLLNLVEALLCSSRSNDLMNAILEGLGCQENKANLKYGCIISFIRIFCYYYRNQELFSMYCIGQYVDLYDKIQNKRFVQKMLIKCFDVFSKENSKDKEYLAAIEQMRSVLGLGSSLTLTSQKSIKQISKQTQSKSPISRNKNLSSVNNAKTQELPKKNVVLGKTTNKSALIVSPEGQLNKILDLLESAKVTEPIINKAIQKCLDTTKNTIAENVYDMFYYCEIAQSFIERYEPNQDTDEVISHFLIDYLKLLSTMQVKASKKTSKITETGLQYLLKLSISKLVLSKELIFLLNSLLKSFGFQTIIKCLGNLYVMGGHSLKKKNKKYLMRWLQQNASEEFINSQYFEVIQAIQNNGQKQKTQKVTFQSPPSIINLPAYQQQSNQIQQRPKQAKKVLEKKYQKEKFKEAIQYKKIEPSMISPIKHKEKTEEIEHLQNADISKIQKIQEQYTDRLDEKWEYFLNKKGLTGNPNPVLINRVNQRHQDFCSQEQQEKYNAALEDHSAEEQIKYYKPSFQFTEKVNVRAQEQHSKESSTQKHNQNDRSNMGLRDRQQSSDEKQEQKSQVNSQQENFQSQIKDQQKNEPTILEYKLLNKQKIIYMINNSTNPFNHLRTLILIPFKSQTSKHQFLRQLTSIIKSQALQKPQPFNSVLLIIILLFTEIKTDKTIIQPLQFLYEFMAQHCTNNEFLKIIISLYHSVIDQTQQAQRKLLLTILTKSMTRIMPFVENALELLKDFQQFYQIGQMVYFQMYPDEYRQIRQVIEHSQSLEEVIHKAFEEEGESLIPIIEGWLQTGFKGVVKEIVQNSLTDNQG